MKVDVELLSILLPGQEPLAVDKYKIVYQPLTKVGCKSLKSWLFLLDEHSEHSSTDNGYYRTVTEDHYNKDSTFHIHNLASARFGVFTNGKLLPPTWKLSKEYGSYKKIVFVRNPWNRIASCYVDKVLPTKQYYKVVQLQNWFREIDNSKKYFDKEGRFTFRGFVEAVGMVLEDENINLYDPHWIPQTTTMYTFIDEYDEIGKLETLNDDIVSFGLKYNFPTRTVGVVDKVLDKNGNHVEKKNSAGKYESFFVDLDLIERVNEIYIDDIELLNYTFEQ